MTSDTRWANAVRALAVVSALTTTIAVLEGATVRQVRRELQQLRDERSEVKAGISAVWVRQSSEEVADALQELNDFYIDEDGVGRPGGLCAGGRLDDRTIVRFALGTFVAERAKGASQGVAVETMRDAVRETDEFKVRHPPAPSAPGSQNAK